jgi:predicted O-methyltransferase YrrM
MSQEQWTAVDRYIAGHLVPSDPVLEAALQASEAAGLPAINVAPNQGKLLQLLAQSIGARNILEIGTLGAYSTIWLARAGLADRVELRLGPALDTLSKLAQEGVGPFDLTFIDADKEHNSDYFRWAIKLSRRGSLIIVDNVVREGGVIDASRHDSHIQGVRDFYEFVAAEPRVSITAVQTVGSKGHDGFAIALVIVDP